MTDDEHEQMIKDCIKRRSKLTEWEKSFINYLQENIGTIKLTEKQIETLDAIWERVT